MSCAGSGGLPVALGFEPGPGLGQSGVVDEPPHVVTHILEAGVGGAAGGHPIKHVGGQIALGAQIVLAALTPAESSSSR